MWWCAGGYGYTHDIAKAGLYGAEHAFEIVRCANEHSDKPEEALVPLSCAPKSKILEKYFPEN